MRRALLAFEALPSTSERGGENLRVNRMAELIVLVQSLRHVPVVIRSPRKSRAGKCRQK